MEEGRGLYIEVQDYMVYVMYTRSARPFTCVGLYFLVRRRNALKWLHQEDTTSPPSQQRTMPLPTDDARLYYRETLLSRTDLHYHCRSHRGEARRPSSVRQREPGAGRPPLVQWQVRDRAACRSQTSSKIVVGP